MAFFRAYVLAILGLACAAAGQSAAVDPVTVVPTGSYAVAQVELSAGLQDAKDKATATPQQVMIGLRDGKLASLWIIRPIAGDSRLMVESSTVVMDAQAVAGDVRLRTSLNRGSPQVDVTLSLKLARAGDELNGSYELATADGKSPYKSAKGTARGKLRTAALPGGTLSPQASWTSFWGNNGDMSAQPPLPPLVDDLSQAKPVFKSESYVPTAYGNAPDSRYFTRAVVSGNCGGGSSPVVADGTIYMHYHAPSPQSEPALKGNAFWEKSYKDDADFKAKMAQLNATDRETKQVLNHFRPLADDHIVAIDATTGAERWHTTLPLRSPNLQTHKHRGISGVPLLAGDTLFVQNLMQRVYAIDTKTGKVKWEWPTFTPMEKAPALAPPLNPSPLLAGGHLVVARGNSISGTVIALDPVTGAERWKAPGAYLLRWAGTKDRLIMLSGNDKRTLACIDAASGQVVWKQEVNLSAIAPLSAVVAGDMLLATPPPPRGSANVVRYEGWKLGETGATRIWQDATEFPADENLPVTVVGGRAYLLGKQQIRILDIATGKQIGQRNFEKDGPGSNPWLGVVGDRLLFLPEGQHGVARLQFLTPDLKDLGPLWLPPHVETTAYNSQPLVYPVVDGRLIIRGGDAIYCYDLRR